MVTVEGARMLMTLCVNSRQACMTFADTKAVQLHRSLQASKNDTSGTVGSGSALKKQINCLMTFSLNQPWKAYFKNQPGKKDHSAVDLLVVCTTRGKSARCATSLKPVR